MTPRNNTARKPHCPGAATDNDKEPAGLVLPAGMCRAPRTGVELSGAADTFAWPSAAALNIKQPFRF